MRAFIAIPLILASVSADAATLRSMTTLHGPQVYLRDLFDDAGANAARVLGPGPDPGGRIIVEAAQLDAIARQFKVDWRPASKADRTLLEWPGRPLPRADAVSAVRVALVAAGASIECEVELPGFAPPTVPFESKPRSEVSQLEYDAASGRFSGILSVLVDGMAPINTRIAGQADDTIELPVATMRLPTGAVLRPEDVHFARIHTSLVRGQVVHTLDQAVGMQLRRQVAPGQPLATADLALPTMVQRGALVQMGLQSPGLSLVGQGIAMDSGATGERIRVLNPTSHAVLEAEVVGPGLVRVAPKAGVVVAAAGGDLGARQ
ncbi:MAG: flagellar basal body P-ring formation chaperone FlgA [Acetobacteraceae bacterium]|nr:flagellar basal body P-ring formation chaperone FlgA [Acetobacteraceae bacterium]